MTGAGPQKVFSYRAVTSDLSWPRVVKVLDTFP